MNVLLSLAKSPDLLLDVLRPLVPSAAKLVVIEDNSPVAFEWIGDADYLGEAQGRPRHRGRYSTSADALIVIEREDGGRTGLVIEWKFTESYDHPLPFRGPGGTDRRDRYRLLYDSPGSPLGSHPSLDAFFHEPHYQLLRQGLLALEMVEAREFGIDESMLVHIIPAGNTALLGTVPDGLAHLGTSIDDVWRQLLPGPRVTYACLDSTLLFTTTLELQERYGMLP